ncbi:hypothetical protein [Yimella lutea]|uniref:hypothetical protein n=1 Tax=Yimella lutea TaxID=587872 RepID=UPI00114D99AE|nr:hypothetical protein [Yimella lutea]
MNTVDVLRWDEHHAVATVDGTRVRIRRTSHRIRWVCATHGTTDRPACPHTLALAATTAPPEKYVSAGSQTDPPTGRTAHQPKEQHP